MYRRAVASDPMNASALSNLAHLLHYDRREHAEAVLLYRRAVAADPADSAALGSLGSLLHTEAGDLAQAEECYRRWALGRSNSPSAHSLHTCGLHCGAEGCRAAGLAADGRDGGASTGRPALGGGLCSPRAAGLGQAGQPRLAEMGRHAVDSESFGTLSAFRPRPETRAWDQGLGCCGPGRRRPGCLRVQEAHATDISRCLQYLCACLCK